MNEPDASSWRIALAFAAIYLIWGSTYLAIRVGLETLPPLLMASSRFFVAGGLLYGYARYRGADAPTGREWRAAGLLGVLLLACGTGGVTWSEQRVPSGLAALMVAIVPVWTVLVDWIRRGGSRPSAQVTIGLVIGFAGVLILIAPTHLAGSQPIDPIGAGVLLMGTLIWSIGTVSAPRMSLPRAPLVAAAIEMLAGGAALLVVGVLGGELGRIHPDAISLRSLVAWGYLIVFGSVIAFSAFAWLLRVIPPARVATYAYVNPAVAVLLGWAVAGESLSLRVLLACAGIIPAVVLITTARQGRSTSRGVVGRER